MYLEFYHILLMKDKGSSTIFVAGVMVLTANGDERQGDFWIDWQAGGYVKALKLGKGDVMCCWVGQVLAYRSKGILKEWPYTQGIH